MDPKRNRIFLDSNVIVPGFFSVEGSPRLILDLISLGLPILGVVTGQFNPMEVERTLRKKLPDALPVYAEDLPLLNLEVVPLPSPRDLGPYLGHVQDKDAPVLASAELPEFLHRILPVLLAGPFHRP